MIFNIALDDHNYTLEDCAKRYSIEYYVLGCFWWILKYSDLWFRNMWFRNRKIAFF